MIVDANLLLYAVDESSHEHERAREWLTRAMNGPHQVGLPWASLLAFLRISTHPRASRHPLSPEQAWAYVQAWLDREVVWVPLPTARHAEVLADLMARHQVAGNLVPDADLAALASEHGLTVYSADTDFARFTAVPWVNPLADA